MSAFALAGLLVAAASPATHAKAGCAAPALTIEASPSRPRQGGIVAVVTRSDMAVERATLSDGRRKTAMEVNDEGRTLRALVGIDFESGVGPRRMRVEAVGLCGDVYRVESRLAVASGRFPTQQLKVAPAYVEPPESEMERIQEEKEKVGRVWDSPEAARRWGGPFRLPVQAPLSKNFGARRVFNGKPRSPHDGIDISAAQGAEVLAPAPAIVALAEDLYFSGGTVILDHGSGLFTTYFHLSRIDVKPGDRVGAGRRIGAVGATGRATGPHLHWGARLHRARVNPLDLLKLPDWPGAVGQD